MTGHRVFECLKGSAFFGVLGPPLGGLLLYTCGAVWNLLAGNYVGGNLLYAAALFILPSYIFGLAPAVVVGAIAGVIRESLSSVWSIVVFGVFSGSVCLAFWYRPASPGGFNELGSALQHLGLPATAAGALLAALFGREVAGSRVEVDLHDS